MLKSFSSPKNLVVTLKKLAPWLGGITFIVTLIGLWMALYLSPPDYQQGETVRIMYVHVPASWFALGVYVVMAFSSAVGFVTKHPLPDLITKAAAPIGTCFTLISLGTGSLWGKPMWGAWWVWDARLTSMLVLLFLYIGYLLLVKSYEGDNEGLKAGRLLIMIGALNIPIIKFSVTWWTTLHQPASFLRLQGPAIHPQMLAPLLVMAMAYGLFFLLVFTLQFETEILKRKHKALIRKNDG